MNMNFIKHYFGIKMLVVVAGFSTMLFSSCNNEDDFHTRTYILSVKNNYFERIDTVALDDKIVCTDIDVNTTVVCEERITNSTHKLICYTHSNLKLIVEFKAISKTEQIMATIHNDGSVSLR